MITSIKTYLRKLLARAVLLALVIAGISIIGVLVQAFRYRASSEIIMRSIIENYDIALVGYIIALVFGEIYDLAVKLLK